MSANTTPELSPAQKAAREKLNRLQGVAEQAKAEAESIQAAVAAAEAEVAQADAWQQEVVQYAQKQGYRDLAHAERKLAKDKHPNRPPEDMASIPDRQAYLAERRRRHGF